VWRKTASGPERPEWTDTEIADAIRVSLPSMERLRKRVVPEGVEAASQDRPRWEKEIWRFLAGHWCPPAARRLDGTPSGHP